MRPLSLMLSSALFTAASLSYASAEDEAADIVVGLFQRVCLAVNYDFSADPLPYPFEGSTAVEMQTIPAGFVPEIADRARGWEIGRSSTGEPAQVVIWVAEDAKGPKQTGCNIKDPGYYSPTDALRSLRNFGILPNSVLSIQPSKAVTTLSFTYVTPYGSHEIGLGFQNRDDTMGFVLMETRVLRIGG